MHNSRHLKSSARGVSYLSFWHEGGFYAGKGSVMGVGVSNIMIRIIKNSFDISTCYVVSLIMKQWDLFSDFENVLINYWKRAHVQNRLTKIFGEKME